MATTRQVSNILTGLQRQGFTQREIAGFTGLSRGFVSDLLAGRRGISTERAADVVERFARHGYVRSLEALDYVRDGLPLADATRRAHTTPATALKYVGRALRKAPTGEWRARASDRLPRIMKALAPEGEVRVLVTDSRKASVLSRYGHAVKKWRETGDRRGIDRFRGQTVMTVDGRRVPLVTDEPTLRQLADAGELADVDDLYV